MAYTVTEQDLANAITKGGKELAEETNPNPEYNSLIVRKQIGPLSRAEIATILTECANALDKIYPVPGNKPLPQKVDSRGRYGAYRLSIQQLVDSAYIDKEVIAWAQGGLQLHGDGPYVAERRSSYADESIKLYGPDGDSVIDFAVPRTEERNNIQYYLIKNEPPSYIRHHKVNFPISSFIENKIVDQTFWAYNLLDFTYKLFLTSRVVDEDDLLYEEDEQTRRESKKSLAGLLAVALCENYDAAINLANGKEKINTDGINSKYWYSIGWNAIADASEKKPYDEPPPVKSPDVTAVANVSSEAISETPTPETASAVTSTTTDNGNPSSTPEVSDTPPPPAPAEAVSAAAPPEKPKSTSASSSGQGYKIDYQLDAGLFGASGYLTETSRVICVASDADRNSLKNTLLSQVEGQLSKAKRNENTTEYDIITALKNDILNNFTSVTEPLQNQKNIPSAETVEVNNPDGTATTTTTTVHDDGSKTVVTIKTNEDGTVSREKQVVPVEPAADTSPPKTEDELDKVRNPANSSPAVAAGRNSIGTYGANNQPSNGDVVPNNDPTKGFKDPKNQYPKRDSVNKPDTNTLAVGVNSPNINADPRSPAGDRKSMSPGASPAARNASRKREVRKAGRNGTTWSQPESPYAAEYPYNKVFGGESGHAIEIDDTPGAERLNWAHRSGTFDEIGPDGTKVTKIIGDGYTIYDKDGYILIEGSANVHLAGACNVFIAGDTNLTMHGKASIDVHNDLDLNVGGHIAVSAGKGIFVRNQGIFSLDNKGDIELRSKGKMTQEVVGTYNVTTTGGYNMTSKANSNVKISGVSYTTSTGDMNFCTDAVFKAKSAGDMNLLTDAVMNQESAGVFNSKSGGAMNNESAGNLSLKAPEVASSKFSAPTIDVTTLHAASTNLKGTDPQGGIVEPIFGSAGPVTPASAAAAAEADCASVAPLSKTVPIELPVSVSVGAGSSSGTGANSPGGSGGGSSESDGPARESFGDSDEGTNDCSTGEGGSSTNGSTDNPVENSSDATQSAGPFQSRPPFGNSDVQNGRQLPAIPNMNPNHPDLDFRLSLGHTLGDLCGSSGFKGKIVPWGKWGTIDILRNLRALCVHFIDPVKKQFPGIKINSGYRPYGFVPRGGAKLSPHMTGGAVDLRITAKPNDGRAHQQLAAWIAQNLPQADQIILESEMGQGGRRYWVHVGIAQPRNPGGAMRGQKLTFRDHEPYKSGVFVV